MTSTTLYFATIVPQWEIFIGVVLTIIGWTEKKELWIRSGWLILIATSLTALYFNLFGNLMALANDAETGELIKQVISTAWQTVAGGALAIVCLILFHFKQSRYRLLATLTLLYFVLNFFLYYQVSRNRISEGSTTPTTEQKK